jgi:hypothetical protein
MMRSTLAAAAFGILAAMPAIYLLSASPRQETAAVRAGAGGAAIEAAAEAWPICSSMASLTESADWAALDPDFAADKRALVAGDWTGAIKALMSAGLRDARNADIQNYLGYAYRRIDDCASSMRRCDIINRRCCSILGTAARMNTLAKLTLCLAISRRPKNSWRHSSKFVSFPATSTAI